MSGESHNVGSSGHPDPRLIAAHADRQLAGAEAARMDEHIARCSECYEVFSETVQFGLAEAPPSVSVGRPAFGRPAFKMVAGLAAAAVLVLAIGLWQQRARFQRGPAAPLAQLVQAMGTRRFVEPRVTGGFRHGRLITLRAGDTPQGLDAQSPAVLAAVARVREQAEGDTSPEALGALGITYLVSGDVAAAVKALESASAQKPDDPRLLSDLAAAYLVRAAQADEPADIPKALEMAERAIALKDAPPEAWFNRALALERLHLVDAARKAWGDYLERDSTSGWADEARQHLEALPKAQQSSVEEDKARARAALDQGAAAIDRLADEEPSVLRDYFEDELLPAWADAHLVGQPDAKLHREHARLVGEALFRTTGDAMHRDAVRALVDLPATAAPDPLRSQALGYQELREAKRLFDLQESSCTQSRGAQRHLEAGGSAWAAWAARQVVIACLPASGQKIALAELDRLEKVAEPRAYLQLLGHVRWLQGVMHIRQGELTQSLERYRLAKAGFEAIKDPGSEAPVLALIAENLHVLGERRVAWRDRRLGLALFNHVANIRRRQMILSEAVLACLEDRLPRTALHVVTALVDAALSWSHADAVSEALTRRAALHYALGAVESAASDLRESRQWIARTSDASLSKRLAAEADATEGEILVRQKPEKAARSLERALAFFEDSARARTPALHLLLARAQMAQDLDDAAEVELVAGILAMERERVVLREAALQLSFFDQALPLFDDMVRFQVERRHDSERALAFVERGRARQLLDSVAGETLTPLGPDALRQDLPDGLVLVYYVPLKERLFVWTLTRTGSHFIERPLPAAKLSRLVAANRAAIEGRAPQENLRRTAAQLHDELVRPLLRFIASQRALVLIPGGILESVAFASLWDRQTGHYLVEDYLLGVAASGTTFLRASSRAAVPVGRSSQALVVGNPQIDRRFWVGMPTLPGAEAEAVEIAALYPRSQLLSGRTATKAAFLQHARSSQLVHFAGHAAASADAPLAARLLFAPDLATRDAGALYLHELGRSVLPRTRVVVLGACRTASGPISHVEGALSLGRPFLAAGVPDVVATLWDIDDAVSREFFVSFHRALIVDGDPLLALRKAQLAFIHRDDASLAHPASWAPFICMGGLDPLSLSKGDV